MDLATYLEQSDISQTDFAARVSTTVATISRIAAGSMRPGLDLAHRIEVETKGKVPLSQWVRAPEVPEQSADAA
jgi:transcriptional regulator with XRE-family HTH domain